MLVTSTFIGHRSQLLLILAPTSLVPMQLAPSALSVCAVLRRRRRRRSSNNGSSDVIAILRRHCCYDFTSVAHALLLRRSVTVQTANTVAASVCIVNFFSKTVTVN